ncbi:MAG: hypothetical protein IJV71_09335 [Lachnospiraceae bacterium]|nr:hypothetical protein [Lachnospiraceae bacterium]
MLTKKMIKYSMEAKWRKRQAMMWAVFILAFDILLLLYGYFQGMQMENTTLFFEIELLLMLVYNLMLGVFVIFYLCRYFLLYRNLGNYDIYEVVLDRPGASYWYNRSIYYTVSFKLNEEGHMTLKTKPLWSSGIFAVFRVEEYNNKKIHIAYNKDTGELITLG